MMTPKQIQEQKAMALAGIAAANAKVWEIHEKNRVMSADDAQEVTNYLNATFNAVEALTPGVRY